MSQLETLKRKPVSKDERFFLRIMRHDLDLVEVPIGKRDIAIGRSPTCDAVLRVKAMAPIQFLVSQNSSFSWSLVDLRAAKGATSIAELKLGKIVDLSGFHFEIVKRSLQPSDYKQGVMEKAFSESDDTIAGTQKHLEYRSDKWLLEIVELWGESRVPEGIYHLDVNSKALREGGTYPISGVPMKFYLTDSPKSGRHFFIDCSQLPSVKIWCQGQQVDEARLERNQVLRIDWMSRAYYVRFVNELALPPFKKGFEGDRFLSKLLGWVFLPIVLMLIIWAATSKPKVPLPKEPQRIARVEVLPPPALPEADIDLRPLDSVVEAGAPVSPIKDEASSSPPTPKVGKAPAPRTTRQRKEATSPNPSPLGAPSIVKAPKAEESGLLGLIGGGSGGGSQIAADPSLANAGPNERARVKIAGQAGSGPGAGGGIGGGNTGGSSTGNGGGGLAAAKRGIGGPGGVGTPGSADVAGITGGIGGGMIGGAGLGSGRGGGRGGLGGMNGVSVGVAGGLSKEAVQRVVRENSGRLRLCYEQALVSNPSLKGKISYNWLIRSDGSVQRVNVSNSELAAPLMESCMRQVILQMAFPRGPNNRPTQVIYPFFFEPR